MNCCFEIEGKIKGKGRPRFSKFGNFVKTYTPEETATYENLIKLQFRHTCGKWYSELPLKMKITAIHGVVKSASKKDKLKMLSGELKPTKKPDADNIVKIICDALNNIAYKDDTQVVELEVKKIYGEVEKVIVEIEEINEVCREVPALEKRLEEFLTELAELTHKYNLVIGGCGCCNSPFIMDMLRDTNFALSDMVCGDLEYDLETKKYRVEEPH